MATVRIRAVGIRRVPHPITCNSSSNSSKDRREPPHPVLNRVPVRSSHHNPSNGHPRSRAAPNHLIRADLTQDSLVATGSMEPRTSMVQLEAHRPVSIRHHPASRASTRQRIDLSIHRTLHRKQAKEARHRLRRVGPEGLHRHRPIPTEGTAVHHILHHRSSVPIRHSLRSSSISSRLAVAAPAHPDREYHRPGRHLFRGNRMRCPDKCPAQSVECHRRSNRSNNRHRRSNNRARQDSKDPPLEVILLRPGNRHNHLPITIVSSRNSLFPTHSQTSPGAIRTSKRANNRTHPTSDPRCTQAVGKRAPVDSTVGSIHRKVPGNSGHTMDRDQADHRVVRVRAVLQGRLPVRRTSGVRPRTLTATHRTSSNHLTRPISRDSSHHGIKCLQRRRIHL